MIVLILSIMSLKMYFVNASPIQPAAKFSMKPRKMPDAVTIGCRKLLRRGLRISFSVSESLFCINLIFPESFYLFKSFNIPLYSFFFYHSRWIPTIIQCSFIRPITPDINRKYICWGRKPIIHFIFGWRRALNINRE